LSDKFRVQNGLKERDALSPLFFNFASDYAIRKVQGNEVGLELNGAHELLIYADDVNLLSDSRDTIKKDKATLFEGWSRNKRREDKVHDYVPLSEPKTQLKYEDS
jgi:hypothetical protein